MNDSYSEISSTGWLPFIGIGFVALLVLAFVMLRTAKDQSLDRVDGVGLTQLVQRWIEAGMPEGERLAEFMQARIGDPIVVSNRVFEIGGTNYVTQFAAVNLRSNRDATLFVTTNKVLIWLHASGRAELYSMNPRQR